MLLHNFNPTLIASFNIVNIGLIQDRFSALHLLSVSRAAPLTLKNKLGNDCGHFYV
jgi:hypothetical protein